MLTPEYLESLPENLLVIFEQMEDDIIADIARRIKKAEYITGTADYQFRIMTELGYSLDEVKKKVAETLNVAVSEVDKIIQDSAELSYQNDIEFYGLGGKNLPALVNNIAMGQIIEAYKKQTLDYLDNLSGTFGFIDSGKFKVVDSFYHDTLNRAIIQVSTGSMSYDDAVRQAVRAMGDKGIRTIDYSSGRSYTIEHVSRMCTVTGINQITGKMSEMNADDMDQDIMEITAHPGARPTHASWQGQLVSRSGQKGYLTLSDIGHGDVAGFMGANCRHNWYPFFPGISKPNWTKETLANIDVQPFEYKGKTYNAYEATQKQRQIERSMRKTKRAMTGFQAAGLENDFKSAAVLLRRQRDEYKQFSSAAGLREQNIRHQTYNYGRSIAQKGAWAARKA